MPFETSVFVNCPFDEACRPLLRPILFAIVDLGLAPRIALESLDSGKPLAAVRDWLNTEARLRARGANSIWLRFNAFMGDTHRLLHDRGYGAPEIERLPVAELIDDIIRWFAFNRPTS